jgi:hypothetical protein
MIPHFIDNLLTNGGELLNHYYFGLNIYKGMQKNINTKIQISSQY